MTRLLAHQTIGGAAYLVSGDANQRPCSEGFKEHVNPGLDLGRHN